MLLQPLRPHRPPLAACALLLPLLAACAAPPFQYALHRPPRIHVRHEPIHPGRDDSILIVAEAETAPGAGESRIRISLQGDGHRGRPRLCAPGVRCALDFPAGGRDGLAVYSAELLDAGGRVVARSASGYSFQIGAGPRRAGANIPLRVPFDLYRGERVFRVLLVRDGGAANYPTEASVLGDVQALLYDGLLADPVYRWRDNQLALYLSTFPGSTSDYHSGLRNRCGQEPWIGRLTEASAEEAAAGAVVVVLHRQSDWRDCAGLGTAGVGGGRPRASADGRRPEVFAHELGHALFGLSDEYREDTASRTPRAAPAPPPGACDCCVRDAIGICSPPGLRECGTFDRPPECFPAPAAACPRLGSSCLRPNVFPSRADCEAARVEVGTHPGLEPAVDPPACRQLCAGASCPCLPPTSHEEVWILDDRTPAVSHSPFADDVMGLFDGIDAPRERHGPACALCLETELCLRWERGRQRSAAEAEAHCLSPR